MWGGRQYWGGVGSRTVLVEVGSRAVLGEAWCVLGGVLGVLQFGLTASSEVLGEALLPLLSLQKIQNA
jgi:hypothetical protein